MAVVTGICFASPAESIRLEGQAFHPFTNAEIVWSATNVFPRGLWIYKVMPEAFSAVVVSNAMAIGHFQTKDLAKTDHPQFQDKYLIYFQNRNEFSRPRFLSIAPTLGAMKYVSQADSTAPIVGVPTSDEAETLARDVLFQLGIDRSLLVERVRKGYDETSTPIDRQGHTLGTPQAVSRGVSFERRIDGIPLSENWCFLIHFGRQGKIEDFSLKWRNIVPFESHSVLSPAQIIQMIKSGQAVLPSQFFNTGGLDRKKRFTIVKAMPRYYNGNGREFLDFMFPYVEMEIMAEMDGADATTFVIQCPILSTNRMSSAVGLKEKPSATGRDLIPKEGLNVLENGQEFTLLSLDPEPETKSTNTFHGFAVLGKVQIKAGVERRAIFDALYGGLALDGPEAMCFNPRHGIHAKLGEQVEDLIICFECGQIYFHGVSDGKLVVIGTPATCMNRVLSAAHISISK
jgi:hypothetical protein